MPANGYAMGSSGSAARVPVGLLLFLRAVSLQQIICCCLMIEYEHQGSYRRFGMPRILIVDDEPNIVLALELLMKREGYEILTVDDGQKVFEVVREFNPDLILLDIMMPKMDGYEVCQRIRADASLKDISIIMLTAKGREVEKEKGLALGADYYITKPFSTREVIMKVKEILAARA
jgi:CheY-like chemotaxis protein